VPRALARATILYLGHSHSRIGQAHSKVGVLCSGTRGALVLLYGVLEFERQMGACHNVNGGELGVHPCTMFRQYRGQLCPVVPNIPDTVQPRRLAIVTDGMQIIGYQERSRAPAATTARCLRITEQTSRTQFM